jgi:hypothetical protein
MWPPIVRVRPRGVDAGAVAVALRAMGEDGEAGSEAASALATRARNWRLVQLDSIFVGIVTAAGTFLPVFLVRLGASEGDVALLTSLPAVTAFVLAIPFGRWLQARRNIVPWYSGLRLVAWLSYAAIAMAVAILPRDQAIPASLTIWALASLPSTAGLVGFSMVMDGAAGPGGRFDLLGRRWAIAGVSTAVAVAVGGQFLNALPFPLNYQALLFIISLAGFGSYLQSSRLVIPDQAPPAEGPRPPLAERLRELWRLVTANRAFTRFEVRTFVYTASFGLSLPLLPLFYVHELAASDAWIGIIAGASNIGAMLGYIGARQLARRRRGHLVLLPSLLAVALATALLAATGWLPAVPILAFVAGVAAAGAQLALFDQMMQRIPRELGVTFSSVDQSVQNFALVVSPSIAGLLAATLGLRETLLVVAAVGFGALALFAVAERAPER